MYLLTTLNILTGKASNSYHIVIWVVIALGLIARFQAYRMHISLTATCQQISNQRPKLSNVPYGLSQNLEEYMRRKIDLFMLLFVLLITVLFFGCATKQNPFTEDKIAQLTPGVTTEQQLVQLFGKPLSQALDSDGRHVLSWGHSTYSVGFMHDTIEMKNLHAVLDDDGVLIKYLLTDGERKFNMFGEVE